MTLADDQRLVRAVNERRKRERESRMSILAYLPTQAEIEQDDAARLEQEAGPERPGWRDEGEGE